MNRELTPLEIKYKELEGALYCVRMETVNLKCLGTAEKEIHLYEAKAKASAILTEIQSLLWKP